MGRTVTEEDWLNGAPGQAVVKARGHKSERKRLLALCAMFGHYRHLLTRPNFPTAVELFEQFADGAVGGTHRTRAAGLLANLDWSAELKPQNEMTADELGDLSSLAHSLRAAPNVRGARRIPLLHSVDTEAIILRDIFGNPFRPVTFLPEWRTSTVVSLAKTMYESRDFAPIPLLADAIQDAGCEHSDILGHCRGTGPHVKGCWVVDLVLEKS